jgi:nucleotide-binding universal stress UspA family protein
MTILCATDFSPSSQSAAQLATTLARRMGDSVSLLHVIEPFVPALPYAIGGGAEWDSGVKAAADELMEGAVKALRTSGVSVAGRVLFGSPGPTIREIAAADEPRLVVLGTHGRKGVGRLFLGSVAAYVVAHTRCPVLVTRPQAQLSERWSGTSRLRTTLALDGTRAGEAALSWANGFSLVAKGELNIVRLYSTAQEALRYGLGDGWMGNDDNPEVMRLVERAVQRQVQAFPQLTHDRIALRAVRVDPATTLSEEADRQGADAIVIGVSRHSAAVPGALAAGSLLREASLPVFCIPEGTAHVASAIPQVRSVLVATDLSDASNQAIFPAYGLLRAGGGRVELCHVHEQGHQGGPIMDAPLTSGIDEKRRAVIESQLLSFIPPDAEARGIATRISIIEGRSAAEAILQAALRLDVDVLAMASHGRSGLGRLALGSTSEEVARHSDRPVLIVRSRKPV